MRARADALFAILLAAGLAGCADVGAPIGGATLDAEAPVPDARTQEWQGRIVVGAASELPAHYPETAPLVAALWPENMRNVAFAQPPASFVVRMDWTAAPGTQVQLMVESPEENGTVDLFTAPAAGAYTSEPSLCVPVPPQALVAGDWKVMPHTRAGADVSFTITLEIVGGSGGFTDDMGHWMSGRDFATRLVSGDIVDHPAEPCDA